MKIYVKALVITILALSCSQELEQINSEKNVQTLLGNSEFQDVIEILLKMGYKESSIVELENYFLVGGDIIFSIKIEDIVIS